MELVTLEQICQENSEWKAQCEKLQDESSLARMVWIAMQMGLWLARKILESEIGRRAEEPRQWGSCPKCGHKLQSKGWRSRQMETLIGRIH